MYNKLYRKIMDNYIKVLPNELFNLKNLNIL